MPGFLLLCLLLAQACAPPSLHRQGWTPAQSPGRLLAQAQADLDSLTDLRAAAELTLVQAGHRQFASAGLLYRAPDLFRIEVRGPLFVHLFTVLVRGDSLVMGDGEGHWRAGPLADAAVSRLLGLDLVGYDLRYALLGLVAPAPLDSLVCVRTDRWVAYLGGSPPRRLELDAARGFITGEELLGSGGEVRLRRRLSDYRRVGDHYLPARVELQEGEHTLVVTYRSWELDTGLQPPAFTRGIPLDRLEPLD